MHNNNDQQQGIGSYQTYRSTDGGILYVYIYTLYPVVAVRCVVFRDTRCRRKQSIAVRQSINRTTR